MENGRTDAIIQEVIYTYWLEMETTINYLAISADLDGIRAEEIKKSLAADIQTEITHAQELAHRIKEIGGRVPGSFAFKPEQASLQQVHGCCQSSTVSSKPKIAQSSNIIRLFAYAMG